MFRKVLNLFGSAKAPAPAASGAPDASMRSTADLLIAQGNQAEEQGDLAGALARYREALALAPGYAKAYVNLAIGLESMGEPEQASAAYESALACDPDDVTANYNLGRHQFSRNAPARAEALIRRAVDLDPGFADARVVLARLLEDRGDLAGAASELERALDSRPDYAGALRNYADVLTKQQRFDEAERALRKASSLEPANFDTNYRLGCVLVQLDKLGEAEPFLNAALAARPNAVEVMVPLVYLHRARGAYKAAAAHAQAALNLRPDWVDLLFDYGSILERLSRQTEAEAVFRRVLELDPGYVRGYQMLGAVLVARGRLREALQIFSQGRARCADAFDLESPELFALNCRDDISAEELFTRHADFGRRLEALEPERFKRYPNPADPERRLRIGFVSPDLQFHVVSSFLLPLLEQRDRRKTEVYCYSSGETVDGVTQLLQAQSDGWRNINKMPATQAADLIHADRIDILIDLAGHSGVPVLRIFAQRPAPVQATWLGYLNTTGLTRIDYRISDSVCDPPGLTERFHTETLVRLPQAQWCYRPFAQVDAQLEPPVQKNGYITFGSFNQIAKLSPTARRLWAAILNGLPQARLRIVGVVNEQAREDLLADFIAAGVDPARVTLMPYVAPEEYFAQYAQVDIALDSTPFSGGTTTCDAVLMGVPVVTVPGPRSWSRSAASVLSVLGLQDWIATSGENYVRLAIGFAGEISTLAQLRKDLRDRMLASPLMDAKQFASDMEAVWRNMWHAWCAR